MKLLLRQLTIQIHVTLSWFLFDPQFLFIASKTINGRAILDTLHHVPILHHHLSHGHIGTLEHPSVVGPVSRVAQGHEDIVCPSLPSIKPPLQCEITTKLCIQTDTKVVEARRFIKSFQFFFHILKHTIFSPNTSSVQNSNTTIHLQKHFKKLHQFIEIVVRNVHSNINTYSNYNYTN